MYRNHTTTFNFLKRIPVFSTRLKQWISSILSKTIRTLHENRRRTFSHFFSLVGDFSPITSRIQCWCHPGSSSTWIITFVPFPRVLDRPWDISPAIHSNSLLSFYVESRPFNNFEHSALAIIYVSSIFRENSNSSGVFYGTCKTYADIVCIRMDYHIPWKIITKLNAKFECRIVKIMIRAEITT